MEINEIEYIYYGDKCIMLDSILEQLESKMGNIKNMSAIYIEKRLEDSDEVIKERAEITPLIKVNGETIKEEGEVICKECSEKYGFEVRHKIYVNNKNIIETQKCTDIGIKEVEKVIGYKKCKKTGCCGGCEKH
jgi:hypothetical protein